MSCGCNQSPCCCTPAQLCNLDNFGVLFPSLVGPMGPPGGPGTFVENLAALRLLDATVFTAGYIAYVASHTSFNDMGGGEFQYDPSGVGTDNDGTLITPSNGIGRWFRLYNGPIDVKWFGAKGDGVTDDSTAITAAIAAASASTIFGTGSVFIPKSSGNYILTKQGTQLISFASQTVGYVFKLTSPLHVLCEGTLSVNVGDATTTNIFLVYNTQNVVIEGVKAVGTGTPSTNVLYNGAAVAIADSTNCTTNNISSTNMRGCVQMFICTSCHIQDGFSQITAGRFSGSHFVGFGCEGCSIAFCDSYQGTTDGDIFFFGTGVNNLIIGCNANNYTQGDSGQTITSTLAQGVGIDSGQMGSKVIDCTAYGYYYGFDIKTTCSDILVHGCVAVKNKVGIAVRRGEGNAPTLNTTISNCSVDPRGGNGAAGTVSDGFAVVGIFIQDAWGVMVQGNTIGVTFYDGSGAQEYLSIAYENTYVGDSGFKQPVSIVGNTFNNALIYGAVATHNPHKSIYITGASGALVENFNISDNEFRLPYDEAIQDYDVISVNYAKCGRITSNSFSRIKDASTGTTIALTNCTGINVSANTWFSHAQLLNAEDCFGISFVNNTLTYGVGGSSLAQIYMDTVQGANISSNSYFRDGSGFTDGLWLEAVNIPATEFNLVMVGNQLNMTNYDSTDYYEVNGTPVYTGVDVVVASNLVLQP